LVIGEAMKKYQVKSFSDANKLLQGKCKNSRKIANNTYLKRRCKDIAIQLHQTDIIKFTSNNKIILNTGNWYTRTTKARMNEHLEKFNVYVEKRQRQWYVLNYDNFEKQEYHDNMILDN